MTAIDTSTEAVERLLDGVTPGPWTEHDAGKHPHVFVCGPDELYYNGEVKDKPLVAYVTGVGAIENRAFIAAARDLVPALLKERDEARARARALEDALRGMMDREARIALQANGHKPLWEASPEWIAAWNALAASQPADPVTNAGSCQPVRVKPLCSHINRDAQGVCWDCGYDARATLAKIKGADHE